MAQRPSIPKGTRDFSPVEVAKRNYISDTVKKHFQTFGFQPIETPSFENSDTLMGKYGDEGDRLIFKILDSGDYFKKIEDIEITFLIKNSLNKTFIFLSKYVLSNFFNDSDLISIQELEKKPEFKSEIITVFKYNFKRNFTYFNRGAIDPNLSKKLISNLNMNELAGDKFLNYFQSFVTHFDVSKKELIKILKNKNHILNFSMEMVEKVLNKDGELVIPRSKEITRKLSEKALRYDLTVPFARYVVMHQNEIDFPFKRYQIQPVWRADRPQKGRFREFYQCDADVVGANSLLQEVEFVQLYDAVFTDLGLNGVTIKLNNRKILAGIAEVIGAKHLLVPFTVALDKLDKIGEEGVKKEMLERGISEAAIEKVAPLFSLQGHNLDQLAKLKMLLKDSEIGTKGVQELAFIISGIENLGLNTASLAIDITLARGLNYYTGAIMEVSAPAGVQMGSIGGGGRYDDLTGVFGLKDVSGVGISFGLDRIYLVLEELNLFPEAIDQSLQVLCVNFGDVEAFEALKLVSALRAKGCKADVYPTATKMQKQMKYANNRKVPYVVLIGAKELEQGEFIVKDMGAGTQKTYLLSNPQEFLNTL